MTPVQLLARCVRGLEWLTAAEIGERLPDAVELTPGPREITFRLAALDPAVLDLRTVDDVFLSVGGTAGVGSTKDVPAITSDCCSEVLTVKPSNADR